MKEPVIEPLSPAAKELVRAGRRATDPTDADRSRVFSALQQKLGGPVPSPDPGGAPLPRPWAQKVAALVAGGGVVAGALVWALSDDASDPAAPAPAPREVRPPVEAAPAPANDPTPQPAVVEAPAPQPSVVPPAPKSPSRPAAPSASSEKGRLAVEVELLSRATSALSSGRPAEALTVLAEHQRRFPRGVLTQERRAARAQALCRLGRTAEAQRELSRLPQASPQAARVRQVCGLDDTTGN